MSRRVVGLVLKKEQNAAQGSATVAMIGWLLAVVFFALWYTAV